MKGSLLEALVLAACAATAAIAGEALVLAFAEGHYLSELASDGEAFRMWLRYLVAFGIVGLAAAVVFLPLARVGDRGRRAGILAVLLALTAPVIWGTLSMRAGALDVLERPAVRLAAVAIGISAVAWCVLAVSAKRGVWFRTTVLFLVAGLLAGPAASTFAVQWLPTEVVSFRGLAVLASAGGVGLLLAWPIARAISARPPRLAPLAWTAGALAVVFGGLVASAPLWRQALPETTSGVGDETSVILIVADTLRADTAADPREAPHLAALARESIVYERAYSAAPWTIPSFASILTSTLPSHHGAGRTDPALGHKNPIRTGLRNLAETLQDEGYSTVAVLSNPTLSPRYGLSPGFDQYENLLALQWYHPVAFGLRSRHLPRWLMPRELAYMRAPTQTRRILAAVDRATRRQRPFFLLAHYMDPHEPYAAPEEFLPEDEALSETQRAYRGEVRYFDAGLGRLIDGLRERGLYDDLLIVFTSDHGQELTEARTDSSHLHGHTLFEEQIRVPLIVKPPRSSSSERRSEPVSLIDVAPTILAVLGLERPGDFRGRNLLEERVGEPPVLFAEGMIDRSEQVAAMAGRAKAMARRLPLQDGDIELYDLAHDPHERDPRRVSGDDGRFSHVTGALREHASRTEGGREAASSEAVEVDPAMRRQLEALGYVE